MIIKIYDIQMQDDVVHFFSKVFKENERNFDLECKEKDINTNNKILKLWKNGGKDKT